MLFVHLGKSPSDSPIVAMSAYALPKPVLVPFAAEFFLDFAELRPTSMMSTRLHRLPQLSSHALLHEEADGSKLRIAYARHHIIVHLESNNFINQQGMLCVEEP